MSRLRVSGVTKDFGAFRALNDIHLDIPGGSLLCLLGPSGCGKTTLLRIIAGLDAADRGGVSIDGEDVTLLPPHRRDIGMVFQSHALFPHLSVGENIGYGLRIAGADRDARRRRVRELLDLVRMPGAADRRISELSGGQRQRVAIARALARQPRIFLLDEPTSALDANLRETMQIELRRLQQGLGITTIVVTHDQGEAMTLADLVVVMDRGGIEQVGPPLEIYENPASAFVADFIGATNMLDGVWRSGRVVVGEGTPPLPARARHGDIADGSPVRMSVRPEKVELAAGGAPGDGEDAGALAGKVVFVRNTGNMVEVHVDCGDAHIVHAFSPRDTGAATRWRTGDAVRVRLPGECCLAYPRREGAASP